MMSDSPSVRRPPGPAPLPVDVRFERHVERLPSGCWRWTGQMDAAGLPRLRIKRDDRWTDAYAYRVGWELAHGEPAAGDLRETCGHRWCVNPTHRIEVDVRESRRRNIYEFWHGDDVPAEE